MPKKKNTDSSGAVSFPEKWLKKINHWVDTANSMSEEELKAAIVEAETNIYTVEREKEENVELQAAKSVLKDIGAGFRDAKAVQTAKIKYALFLLESRGVDLSTVSSSVE